MSEDEPRIAGELYAELIDQQLRDRQADKNSIEQRGVSVITSAGVLVTFLFGLTALARRGDVLVLTVQARVLLGAAAAAFLSAASLGIAANLPQRYAGFSDGAFDRMVTPELWMKPAVPASRRIAEAKVEIIKVGRQMNRKKLNFLRAAITAHTAGVGLLGAAVAALLLEAS